MNMRSIWWLALAFTLTWIWLEWTQFTALKTQQTLESSTAQEVPMASQNAAVSAVNSTSDVPAANAGGVQSSAVPVLQNGIVQGQRIHVKTDTLELIIDANGGDIRDAKLLQYAANEDRSQPYHLMSDTGPLVYMAQNGLAKLKDAKLPVPTHQSVYQTAQTSYEMTGDTLVVPLTWSQDGVTVTKTYTFTKGKYLVDVAYKVENAADVAWAGSLYSQLVRNRYNPDDNFMMYTYTGPVLYDGNAEEKYVKHSFDDLNTQAVSGRNVTGGWAAMIQQYFLTAIIPNQSEQNTYYAMPLGNDRYAVRVVEPLVEVAPGQSQTLTSQLFIGPESQNMLAEIAPGLELTIDYGILTFLAEPLFWLLDKIHS
ncbi:MAG: membrane protein insertase YidC, partial [Thiomicrorhabdus sp.]|nr:membrane protein insertase YidC [Thiomicrorhabdus sp.]